MQPSDVNPNDYIAIHYTGGHGVMWDFPNNPELQQISLTIYNNGGYIISVCHGIAGLLNIKDKNGDYLMYGQLIAILFCSSTMFQMRQLLLMKKK